MGHQINIYFQILVPIFKSILHILPILPTNELKINTIELEIGVNDLKIGVNHYS